MKMKMARPHIADFNSWTQSIGLALVLVIFLLAETEKVNCTPIDDSYSSETLELTACQHLRRAETRRAKSLGDNVKSIRIPRCNKLGDFEPIQCSNEINNSDCWCVDEYGVEISDTRKEKLSEVNCSDASISKCLASSCRMFCSSGFANDPENGCPICRCRDPCDSVECPNGLQCEPQEVRCSSEPCPPIPTCRKARSLNDLCPAGQPLSIQGTARPFLCGTDPGKPSCPPLYRCLVQNGNDYGVCCPASLKFEKPGTCPRVDEVETRDETGVLCGTPCGHDLECPQMKKCCQLNGCGRNCVQPHNITTCYQARMLSELLSVNEREGRGYIPQCDGPGGSFSTKQCSRNGLVCWCVDMKSGNKVKGTMGAAKSVNCESIEKAITNKASGRSVDGGLQCDYNICAAVCEYGFKVDHNGCPTCECSDPCEGFRCPMGSHCEVARDGKCTIDSDLCSSEPVCKPDIVYSNPCDFGTPLLANNYTGELAYCNIEKARGREYQRSFFDEDPSESRQRSLSKAIICPETHRCMKLHGESGSVCCPIPFINEEELLEERQQSMCEYLRDFSDRMEGTEEGMTLALPPPSCYANGGYKAMQCTLKKKIVTRSEQRKIMEQNNIRQMRMLLENSKRTKRSTNLKLIKIEERNDGQTDLIRISERQLPLIQPDMIQSRSARIIESRSPMNSFDQIPSKSKKNEELVIEIDVEECWCVDVFGTEIPKTRGTTNVSLENCETLRQNLECLDITCRMGCDYGFMLDSKTQCPSCECRDPCEGVSCLDNQECRSVEVSCDGEYCPPVPACFPKKPGQCPFLVPPGAEDADADACDYECRSDSHCEGSKRCCSNGCGTQCVEPQLKTACQHLQTIQLHQAAELGMPARQKYIAQCNEDGSWKTIQCGPGNCWCVDEFGNEKSGTRTLGEQPNCEVLGKTECPMLKCHPCEYGYKFDAKGMCKTCECKDPCGDISCPAGEKCDLVQVECISLPCPKMAICVPTRESVCPEGNPLKLNDREISCGPHTDTDLCPTTHMCQLNPITNRGTCCAKTRDVCFESIDSTCLSFESNENNNNELDTITKWRFSPRSNKCVPVNLPKMSTCLSKNLFHSEFACKSVCPVLSQCERLRMKNNMAAKRAGQTNTWFQPRCDPEGFWSPVQCLGGNSINEALGVCWCADKKGAPMKGSLTKNIEPVCNSRQARRKLHPDEESSDPVMEELIRQITFLVDENNFMDEAVEISNQKVEKYVAVTEKIIEIARSDDSNFIEYEPNRRLKASNTRCTALKFAASFPVACDSNGAFLSTQCNGDICWCVDAAGNQLPLSSTFKKGMRSCLYTPVDAVEVELLLNNPNKASLVNVVEVIKAELSGIIGNIFDNFRVNENSDLSVKLKFDLIETNKVDDAFAIEEMVRDKNFILYRGQLVADSTQSRFSHRIANNLPIPQHSSGIPESTFQTIVFILATASAFLISIFVVFIMLKRGKNKMKTYNTNKTIGNGDKFLDYSSPIFVLSANDKDQSEQGEDNSRSNGIQ